MPSPNSITLTCPLCSLQFSATKSQNFAATRGPGGAVGVTISLAYDTQPHICTGFPADVSQSPAAAEKSATKRKTSVRKRK